MIFSLFFVALLCVNNIKLARLECGPQLCYNDYMSIEKTNSIKGIFILLVFFSHTQDFICLSDSCADAVYITVNNIIGQSVVSPFLIFSGYGIIFSIATKKEQYLSSIPTKRFLKVLLHFDIAVLLFLLVQTILGKHFTIWQIVLSFVAWDSIGNSNWYIFVILCLYLITYASFSITNRTKYPLHMGALLTCILSVALIVVLHTEKGGQQWWYDTVMCYPAGMALYLSKDRIDKMMSQNRFIYYIVLVSVANMTLLAYKFRGIMYVHFLKHILVGALIVLVSMKVAINNRILNFFGKHLFAVYIIMRIPMLILDFFGFSNNNAAFVILSLFATIVFAIVFDNCISKFDSILFRKN